MVKPYILFVYSNYYPSGGMKDLLWRDGNIAKFETIDDAVDVGRYYDQYQVVNWRTLEVVYSTENIEPKY